MPLPDAAALDRIHATLLARRANRLTDAEVINAIELVLDATGREYVHDAPAEPVPLRRAPHLRLVEASTEDKRAHLTDDEPSD